MGNIDWAAVYAIAISVSALAVDVFCIRVLRLSLLGERHAMLHVIYMFMMLTASSWLIVDFGRWVVTAGGMPAFVVFVAVSMAVLFTIGAVVDRRDAATRARGPASRPPAPGRR